MKRRIPFCLPPRSAIKIVLLLNAVGCLLLTSCAEKSPEEAVKVPPVKVVEYLGGTSTDSLASYISRQPGAPNVPVVYFYANWCGPCKRFKESLHDERVAAVLQDATIIKIDVDTHQELAAFFGVNAIPAFIKMNKDGQVLARISSDKWEEDVPENIAPVMNQLVHTTSFDTK